MSLFGNLPAWKERAYIFMAIDTTMKGLAYIIPEEVVGFEVPTIRDAETILYRTRTNLNRARGFLAEVVGEEIKRKPVELLAK